MQLSTKWKESLGTDGSAVVNAPRYFSRFFLDVIGEGPRFSLMPSTRAFKFDIFSYFQLLSTTSSGPPTTKMIRSPMPFPVSRPSLFHFLRLRSIISLISPMFSVPTKTSIFVLGLMEFLPISVVKFFIDYAPVRGFQNSRRVTDIAVGIAKELVDQKSEALLAGKGKRDIMSLLGALNYHHWFLARFIMRHSQGQCLGKSAYQPLRDRNVGTNAVSCTL
jgi:hypothetical protein